MVDQPRTRTVTKVKPGPWTLGIAASHNGAVCLLEGTRVVAAIQEERLTRVKRASIVVGQPLLGLDYVLETAGISVADLDVVVVAPLHDGPKTQTGLATQLVAMGCEAPVSWVSHHRAHAVAAYALSGFEDAVVLVVDGMGSAAADLDAAARAAVVAGEPDGREIVSIYTAINGVVEPVWKQLSAAPAARTWVTGDHRPAMMPFTSLGVMYQSVAQQVFGGWFDAGKVMGLAPYGQVRWPRRQFVEVDTETGVLRFGGTHVSESFRHDERWPAHRDAYQDLAASVQAALETAMLDLAKKAGQLTGKRNLCLAGGVALNSVANEQIVQSAGFDAVYVMPSADDAGTALGAAFSGAGRPSTHAPQAGSNDDAMGASYDIGAAIKGFATDAELSRISVWEHSCDSVDSFVAEALATGAVVGWFQGRAEFGPRALGHRSILLDPRRVDGKAHLNLRVKHREPFRPFAPAVLETHAHAWFELGRAARSPFMLRVVPVRASQRARIPAVVHIDGTARLQTVGPDDALFGPITQFHAATGVPILVNTSFNVAGEPIVETPADAARCFVSTGIDVLVLGQRVFVKPGWRTTR